MIEIADEDEKIFLEMINFILDDYTSRYGTYCRDCDRAIQYDEQHGDDCLIPRVLMFKEMYGK